MAWTNLPTDYTDASWSGNRKYTIIQNDDDTVSLVDVTNYSNREKSFFGALDANQMNTAINKIMATFFINNAGAHNAIYRGICLGDSVTEVQYNAISSGTFEDLYIGDYWTINGRNYRIAAFDYYYRCGDTELGTHHAVIVPDIPLYNSKMNDTNITTGGYVGSKMYTEGLENAKTIIKNIFSDHILSHRIYLINAVSNGLNSAGAWCDSEVDLMNEQMVYGSGIFCPTSDGSSVPANYTIEKSQLPLFRHNPFLISNRNTYWLRDVITPARFTRVSRDGRAYYSNASDNEGVRPFFCIS